MRRLSFKNFIDIPYFAELGRVVAYPITTMKSILFTLGIFSFLSSCQNKEVVQTFHFSGWQKEFVTLGNSYRQEYSCYSLELTGNKGLEFILIAVNDKNEKLANRYVDKRMMDEYISPIQIPDHSKFVKFMYFPQSSSTEEAINEGVKFEIMQLPISRCGS